MRTTVPVKLLQLNTNEALNKVLNDEINERKNLSRRAKSEITLPPMLGKILKRHGCRLEGAE
jgi:hypothetical protein